MAGVVEESHSLVYITDQRLVVDDVRIQNDDMNRKKVEEVDMVVLLQRTVLHVGHSEIDLDGKTCLIFDLLVVGVARDAIRVGSAWEYSQERMEVAGCAASAGMSRTMALHGGEKIYPLP